MKRPDGIGEVCDEFEREVAMDDRFVFPLILSEHNILGKHLIIAPNQANWLVCNNEEYAAFCLFKDCKTVQEVFGILSKTVINAMDVISHLLAQVLSREFLRDVEIIENATPNVLLRLTSGCNLRCTTCCFSCTVPGEDECTLEQWKSFLRALRDYGVEVITLSGGEPMMNPDCIDIIVYAKKIGFKILLLTNGTLVNRENAKLLGENCDQIRISIDGPNAAANDSVRGAGMFEKAISALRYLSDFPQCRLTIAMTPTPETLPVFQNGLRDFACWVHKEISSDITFEVTGILMEGRNVPKMSEGDQGAFLELVTNLCNDQLDKDFVQKLAAINIIPNTLVVDCGLGGTIPVKASGDVGLCSFFPSALCNIKDIRNGNGKEFVSDMMKRVGEYVESIRVENLTPCAECDIRYFCGGGCRKKNKEVRGSQNICDCDEAYRRKLRENLVLISPYMIEALNSEEGR